MNSEQQTSWRRHIAFDPMNAHSQGDDPNLMYVVQFNADERQWQEAKAAAAVKKQSPVPKLQQHMEWIQHLPRAQQRFVMQIIATVLAQHGR